MNKFIKILTYITQFGLMMLIPICLCFFAGLWLDKKLGTNFLVIIFFFIGALAGFTGVFRMIKKYNEQNPEYTLSTKERRERNHKK